jgi:nitroreductase|tara:strand:+ start:537 stop:1208 length:672 start_codon:yes stop_codon:yes gene_type:complete
MNKKCQFISYSRTDYSTEELIQKSNSFFDQIQRRRSVRNFSNKRIPKEVIENIIKTAGTAPSGANKQPWTFCAISNQELKCKIRTLAENEEFENYHGRMSIGWMKDLEPMGTNHIKKFLETAPYLIVVFKKVYDLDEKGEQHPNYYVNESAGIASGFLLTAIHQAGLVALTHTPSPMNFLQKVLNRPENERPFLLIPVGYPTENCKVPDIKRKPLQEIIYWYS